MSTVIESKPWWAMISAENELGIVHQPLMTALPRPQISDNVLIRISTPGIPQKDSLVGGRVVVRGNLVHIQPVDRGPPHCEHRFLGAPTDVRGREKVGKG